MANVTSTLFQSPLSCELMTNLAMNDLDQNYIGQTVQDCCMVPYAMDASFALYSIAQSVMCGYAESESLNIITDHILQGITYETGVISRIVDKYAYKAASTIMSQFYYFESTVSLVQKPERKELKDYNISVIRGEFQKLINMLNSGPKE
jgi:hypothetical protein